jgi:hypothetical protein
MMQRERNGIVIGALVLALCLLTPMVLAGRTVTQRTSSPVKEPVTFWFAPGPGVYWNDKRIMDLPVMLVLHYHFKPGIPITLTASGESISCVEFYLDDSLIFNDTDGSDGFKLTIHPGLPVPDHGQTGPLRMIAYGDQVYISENITIYRLWL